MGNLETTQLQPYRKRAYDYSDAAYASQVFMTRSCIPYMRRGVCMRTLTAHMPFSVRKSFRNCEE